MATPRRGFDDGVVEILVEVPMGSRNKYEFDEAAGRFRLDRMLFTATRYPGDYGYVPRTLAGDGDALDALVILGEPTFSGCLIDGRVLGVLRMTDKGADDKILTVPDGDPRWRHLNDLTDVPEHLLAEIAHFFSIYKDLENAGVVVGTWSGREDALAIVADALAAYA